MERAEEMVQLWRSRGQTFGVSEWLDVPEYHMRVYLRVRNRYINGRKFPAVDIATVEVDMDVRGQGLFTAFLDNAVELLALRHGLVVYVENVLEERFRGFFPKKGHAPDPACEGCFFK